MHFIPTYSSWLNQVERFFGLITDKTIRRGSFSSVKDRVAKIDHFVASYNKSCKPFAWTATADSILAKLHRLCSPISGTAPAGLSRPVQFEVFALTSSAVTMGRAAACAP